MVNSIRMECGWRVRRRAELKKASILTLDDLLAYKTECSSSSFQCPSNDDQLDSIPQSSRLDGVVGKVQDGGSRTSTGGYRWEGIRIDWWEGDGSGSGSPGWFCHCCFCETSLAGREIGLHNWGETLKGLGAWRISEISLVRADILIKLNRDGARVSDPRSA